MNIAAHIERLVLDWLGAALARVVHTAVRP